MVLEQKPIHRSMEQNQEPRIKPTHLWPIKEGEIYSGEKTASSVSEAGKTG